VEKVLNIVRDVVSGVLFWLLVAAGLGLLLLVMGLPLVRQLQTMETMQAQMEARDRALKTDVARLTAERDALCYDPFYVEKVARRDYNMSRKGEQQLALLPASYTRTKVTAEQHINTSHAVGLWRLYGMLNVLAEDTLLRQIACILAGLSVVAAVLLFGRGAQKQPQHA
jgi:cell division protein FtsB